MYDELVKRIWECASGECFNCSQYKPTANASVCQKELIKQAANAIEELSRNTRELPRWIPVTERLPERGQNVIVANKRGKQWDIDKAWLSCLGSGFDRCGKRSLYHVTHWMPLPEPPKEV